MRTVRLALWVAAVVSASLLIAPVHAAPSTSGGSGSVSLPPDPVLDRTVTVRRGHVYLGELVSELSRQAGLPLAVSQTQGPLDGVMLTVYVKDQPLRSVMGALTDLLATRHHRVEWERRRSGSGGYVLTHFLSFEVASAAAREEMLRAWKEDLDAVSRLAKLPDSARTGEAARALAHFPEGASTRGSWT